MPLFNIEINFILAWSTILKFVKQIEKQTFSITDTKLF